MSPTPVGGSLPHPTPARDGVDTVRPGGRWAAWTEAAVLGFGVLGLFAFGFVSLWLGHYLAQVDPRREGLGVMRARELDGTYAVLVLLSSLALLAAAGLPRWRRPAAAVPAEPASSLRPARGSSAGAVVQGVGGLLATGGAILGRRVSDSFYFTGTNDACRYESCWPLDPQAVTLVVPGVVAGLTLVAMAALVRRAPWLVRAVTPVLVWLAALAVQYLIWTPYLLPLFEGPPR